VLPSHGKISAHEWMVVRKASVTTVPTPGRRRRCPGSSVQADWRNDERTEDALVKGHNVIRKYRMLSQPEGPVNKYGFHRCGF
jgi:hypothetical protein